MANEVRYPKRLIEVDLPIKEISAHARREKSIRHGHISTLHIWWARRPLAACRAVICASLWPDPADDLCPQSFRDAVGEALAAFAERARTEREVQALVQRHWTRWSRLGKNAWRPTDPACWWDMRYGLLDFIGDFANWDASTQPAFLTTARRLTQAAHESLGGGLGTRPLVVDPFAGGGSIPLEALRVGADAFASDLNPVAVLLNKVILEYIPRHGQRLADEVRKWGEWIRCQAEQELTEVYPLDKDGSQPVAFLWARTVRCEGPGCGALVPIFTNDLLAKHREGEIRLKLEITTDKQIRTVISIGGRHAKIKTVYRGAVLCPVCQFTTSAGNVRRQFFGRSGGTSDSYLLAVVTTKPGGKKRSYRPAEERDMVAVRKAFERVASLPVETDGIPTLPEESLPYLRSIFNINLLGVNRWRDLFTPRQLLLLATFTRIVREFPEKYEKNEIEEAITTCMAIAVNKMADFHSSLCAWINLGEKVGHTFGRQALGIIWDYTEANPFANISGAWSRCIDYLAEFIEANSMLQDTGHASLNSATSQPMPDDSAQAIVTDPPYYDAVPYADLSDFFYVWFKRSLKRVQEHLFEADLSPKQGEIVQLAERNSMYSYKTGEYFESLMRTAMAECRRVLAPSGIGLVVFAHKSTAGWEAQLQAMLDAGWCITASWPIDTERPGRLRAMDSAVLASSIHLICRPRKVSNELLRADEVGDWREVLQELPRRIHEWMPRLAEEGVVGADAIFACLGPALEIFSRYSRVEKASGVAVKLREYLEQVWAAVGHEALSMIFQDVDTTGLEEDARLTAMWLWTLSTEHNGNGRSAIVDDEAEKPENEEETGGKPRPQAGFTLEYDAARKIAQGLGANLEGLRNLVEIKGETARLLPVAERTRYLFGKEVTEPATRRRAKKVQQIGLFQELEAAEKEVEWGDAGTPSAGSTALDRIHQAMILFAAGRADALKRFLVEDGIGGDSRFWKLAQSLSALYPTGTDEKRWVDGVLARKKSLGFG
ncbi:MAG: putative methylase [Acidobacteriota bacterium]|jgi:adenine-specific DNA methylase|nr:putative methylase [Acidobacteriota bacterium]